VPKKIAINAPVIIIGIPTPMVSCFDAMVRMLFENDINLLLIG